jgi:hypothetical protein
LHRCDGRGRGEFDAEESFHSQRVTALRAVFVTGASVNCQRFVFHKADTEV